MYLLLLQIYDFAPLAAKSKGSKIDVSAVRGHYTVNSMNEYVLIDNTKILYDILLKELPMERVSGIVNLMLAMRPASTDNEINNALVKAVFFCAFFW